MNETKQKETVFVAMSGGVDSSVAAGLLVRQGYNVVGVTLIFRPCDDNDNVSWCCGRGAQENARAVCQTLGIRHYAIDCAKEFEAAVLRPAWDSYRTGRTPSPCILCNADIKFKIIMERAKALGATKLATGHYAIVEHGERPTLRRGDYAPKDQTYFLFSLNRDQLNFTLFPLGKLKKSEVRELAREMGFVNAERKESQDACFVTADGNFQEALRQRFDAPLTEGQIVDPDGNVLGNHSGIHNYTIGQRKGLNIALGKRAFVSKIDAATQRVVLTTNESDLLTATVVASGVQWTGDVAPQLPLCCDAQIRYRSKPAAGTASIREDGKLLVVFNEPQKAVAPGQALVLYNGNQVLGGGWIESSH
ncbi:MAG: tRNA 2-thiouridine(34) synthase MnmA [Deltaproteobacteria bacterium]|nr:tRNA 2-thiouridine(34) synthase MnmA [Deltaproteobacteria bacterium]